MIRKSLSKVSGLTSEARYRNLFQESRVVLISSLLLMLLLKVLLKIPLSCLTSAYYLGMLLGFFFFSSESAFSSTLIRFYSERIYSCLNSPVYLMPVKQLADQLRVPCRQPACSKIIQVYLATKQRDAWTHAAAWCGAGSQVPSTLSSQQSGSPPSLPLGPASLSLVRCPGTALTS